MIRWLYAIWRHSPWSAFVTMAACYSWDKISAQAQISCSGFAVSIVIIAVVSVFAIMVLGIVRGTSGARGWRIKKKKVRPHTTPTYNTIPWHTIPHHTNRTIPVLFHTTHHTMTSPCHTIPYHAMLYHTTPCPPCHTIPHHAIPYHTVPYRTTPCHTTPLRAIPWPYHTTPSHTISYHAVPHSVPYYTMPYDSIPCHTVQLGSYFALLTTGRITLVDRDPTWPEIQDHDLHHSHSHYTARRIVERTNYLSQRPRRLGPQDRVAPCSSADRVNTGTSSTSEDARRANAKS